MRSTLTLALTARRERSPSVIVPEETDFNDTVTFGVKDLPGDWLRVYPSTAADVRFLQMLEHRLDKYAPAKGGGVIIARRCLPVVIKP